MTFIEELTNSINTKKSFEKAVTEVFNDLYYEIETSLKPKNLRIKKVPKTEFGNHEHIFDLDSLTIRVSANQLFKTYLERNYPSEPVDKEGVKFLMEDLILSQIKQQYC